MKLIGIIKLKQDECRFDPASSERMFDGQFQSEMVAILCQEVYTKYERNNLTNNSDLVMHHFAGEKYKMR